MSQRSDLENLLKRHDIGSYHRDIIVRFLDVLWLRSIETSSHSLRVAQRAAMIASWRGIQGARLQSVLQAGLLHDIGKSLIDPIVLRKTGEGEWMDKDTEEMDRHPEYGWRLLRGVDEFLAAVVIRHHRFGPRPYPHDIPPLPVELVLREDDIEEFARIIAFADTYDALMTRPGNARFPALSVEDRRKTYRKLNPGQDEFIACLEREGVITFKK
jgi:HD-GYP domain-containing protein (c-di-GMP phosphodiesterase class II)